MTWTRLRSKNVIIILQYKITAWIGRYTDNRDVNTRFNDVAAYLIVADSDHNDVITGDDKYISGDVVKFTGSDVTANYVIN